MVTIVTYGHNCHILSQLSCMVTIVTYCHNCQIWSQLSHMVTIVTYGHNCHTWSQLSHVVTCRVIAAIQISISHHPPHPPPPPLPEDMLTYGSFVADGKNAKFLGIII